MPSRSGSVSRTRLTDSHGRRCPGTRRVCRGAAQTGRAPLVRKQVASDTAQQPTRGTGVAPGRRAGSRPGLVAVRAELRGPLDPTARGGRARRCNTDRALKIAHLQVHAADPAFVGKLERRRRDPNGVVGMTTSGPGSGGLESLQTPRFQAIQCDHRARTSPSGSPDIRRSSVVAPDVLLLHRRAANIADGLLVRFNPSSTASSTFDVALISDTLATDMVPP